MDSTKTAKEISRILSAAQKNDKNIRKIINEEVAAKIREDKEQKRKEMLQVFAANLKRYREEKGFSKLQLGNMLGVLPQNYHRYENGTQEPGATMALQMASILNVTVNDLFESESNKITDALKSQSWLESAGFKTYFDSNNTITLSVERLPAKAVSIEESKILMENTKELLKPLIQLVINSEIDKLQYKDKTEHEKRHAGTLKLKTE